ncbi:MAG: hypothetical protein FJ125_08820, partial [Deltaproteobacteria bacterium]|nr:hypothetical protein [Deltaproteobacteria bacterium]
MRGPNRRRSALLVPLLLLGWAGAAAAQPSQPTLLVPLDQSYPREPVTFAWDPGASPGTSFTLQVATDSGFAPASLKIDQAELTAPAGQQVGFWCCHGDRNPSCCWWVNGQQGGCPGDCLAEASATDGRVSFRQPANGTLVPGITYHWRVKAHLAGQPEAISATRTFRLGENALAVLQAPLLSYPEPETRSLWKRPGFLWDYRGDATEVTFRLEVDNDSGFGSKEIDKSGLAPGQGYQHNTDLAAGRYYWRVTATRSDGTTVTSNRQSFHILDPLVRYELDVQQTAPAGGSYQETFTGIAGTSFTVPQADQLPEAGTFQWQMRAVDEAGNATAWVGPWRVTLADTFAPPAPRLSLPVNDARVLKPEPYLVWESSAGATSYKLQVSGKSDFGSGVVERTTSNGWYQLTRDLGLAMDTPLFWKVAALDAGGSAAWSAVRTFTIVTPKAAYTLQIDEQGQGFGDPLQQVVGLSAPQHALVDPLPDSGSFSWRVQAVDLAGNEQLSNVLSIALADKYPPPTPLLIAPKPSEELVNPQVTFQWTPVVDSGGLSYRLEIADNQDFSAGKTTYGGLVDSFHLLASPLVFGKSYWWRVVARDGGGRESTSAARTFAVVS